MKLKSIRNSVIGGTLLILVGVFHYSHTRDDHHTQSLHSLKIGGTSDTIAMLESLTEAYIIETQTKAIAFDVAFDVALEQSSDTVLEQVRTRAIAAGTINRSLTPEEQKTVTYVPLTTVPLAIAVHNSVTNVTALSPMELQAIYQGDMTNWQAVGGPDAEIVVFDIAETAPAKAIFRQTYLGETLTVTPNAVVLADERESLDMASTTDFSISIVPLNHELDAVSAVNIQGTSETKATAGYAQEKEAMHLPIGMVVSSDPNPDIQSLVDFAQSSEGQNFLARTN